MKTSYIILIGMPGAGKTIIGTLLAKTLKKPFIDTDLLIRENENMPLQEIIKIKGIAGFLSIEENVILNVNLENHIIATGGSVIYSEKAIAHLKNKGTFIYLKRKYEEIEKRIRNIFSRGVVIDNKQSLFMLYNERIPLYEKHADIIIECTKKSFDTIIVEINKILN